MTPKLPGTTEEWSGHDLRETLQVMQLWGESEAGCLDTLDFGC